MLRQACVQQGSLSVEIAPVYNPFKDSLDDLDNLSEDDISGSDNEGLFVPQYSQDTSSNLGTLRGDKTSSGHHIHGLINSDDYHHGKFDEPEEATNDWDPSPTETYTEMLGDSGLLVDETAIHEADDAAHIVDAATSESQTWGGDSWRKTPSTAIIATEADGGMVVENDATWKEHRAATRKNHGWVYLQHELKLVEIQVNSYGPRKMRDMLLLQPSTLARYQYVEDGKKAVPLNQSKELAGLVAAVVRSQKHGKAPVLIMKEPENEEQATDRPGNNISIA